MKYENPIIVNLSDSRLVAVGGCKDGYTTDKCQAGDTATLNPSALWRLVGGSPSRNAQRRRLASTVHDPPRAALSTPSPAARSSRPSPGT